MSLKIYQALDKVPFLKRYSYKFLFTAFLGIHVPLIGFVVWIAFAKDSYYSPTQILLICLGFTLFATGVTLIVLNKLLKPLSLSKEAVVEYQRSEKLPDLPSHFKDEAGVLMSSIQTFTENMDALLETKKNLYILASHDLREPANRVISAAELLETANDELKAKLIALLRQSGEHQLSLIDKIMTMLQSDEVVISHESKANANILALVDSVISQLAISLEKKELKVENKIKPEISALVESDLFAQVIKNLIGNAIKFSNRGGTILVKSERKGGGVKIWVQDEGVGFSSDNAEELFKKFTNQGKEGTEGEPSTGVGLYLCRDIIKKHGGSLTAKSAGKGKGARFEIFLPD